MSAIPLVTFSFASLLSVVGLLAQPTEIAACFGERLTITGPNGFDTYTWSPSTGLSNSQGQATSFSATNAITYVVASQEFSGVNLVANPDFELGNQDFSSQYRYVPGGTQDQGTYAILSEPKRFNVGFAACTDPTTPGGDFLVADGSVVLGDQVWCQDVRVRPNATYAFSTLLTALVPDNPARLAFSINDRVIGSLAASSDVCTWQRFYALWASGAANQARICILNVNSEPQGNDFALDQISLSELSAPRLDSFRVSVKEAITASIVVPLCPDQRFQQYGLDLAPDATGVVRLDAANGCDSTLTVTTVVSDTMIQRGRIDTLCPGESITFESEVFTSDTTVCKLYRSSIGCDSTFCLTVKFLNAEALLVETIAPSCPGASDGSLLASSTAGRRPLGFRWSDGVTDSVRTNLAAGTYTLTVTDDKGCSASRNFVLPDPPPLEVIDILTLGVRCFGETTGLALVEAIGGTGPLSFEGILGGQSYNLDTLTQGLYTLRVTDSLGCSVDSSFTIDGPPEVMAAIEGDTIVKLGVLGTYRGQFSGDLITTFWSYNGVSIDTLVVNDEVTWRPPGDGVLVVRAVDANGCEARDELVIRLQPLDTEFFPNAFSPNGDGINDSFGPAPDPSIAELTRFDIFDRWGGHLYGIGNCSLANQTRTCDWTGRIDGITDGNTYDPGVYVYYAKLRLIDGTEIERKGDLMLMK